MLKTKNDRLNLSSKCAVSGSKNSRFMKEQETRGLLSKPLSKMQLLGNLLFYLICV